MAPEQRRADELRQAFDDQPAELLRESRIVEAISMMIERGNADQLTQAALDAGLDPKIAEELRKKIVDEQANVESMWPGPQLEQWLEKVPPQERDEMRARMIAHWLFRMGCRVAGEVPLKQLESSTR